MRFTELSLQEVPQTNANYALRRSPSLGCRSELQPKNGGERAECSVHRRTIGKHIQHFGINDGDVSALGISRRRHAPLGTREVVLGPHGVAVALLVATIN